MAAFSSIIAAIGTVAAVTSGVATAVAASESGQRPLAPEPYPLSKDQDSVAGDLASSFNRFSEGGNPVTGKPTLGQGLAGGLNTPVALRDRLNSVGEGLSSMIGPRPGATPIQPRSIT